jgi:hypothetical protein
MAGDSGAADGWSGGDFDGSWERTETWAILGQSTDRKLARCLSFAQRSCSVKNLERAVGMSDALSIDGIASLDCNRGSE